MVSEKEDPQPPITAPVDLYKGNSCEKESNRIQERDGRQRKGKGKGTGRWAPECSQALTRNEDEQTADSRVHQDEQAQHSSRPRVQGLAHKWFSYPVEVEQRVLAVADHGDDWIKHVLVCEDEVEGHSEGQYDLFLAISTKR